MTSSKIKTSAIILLSIIVILAMACFAYKSYRYLTRPIIPADQSYHYILKPGTTIRGLAKELKQQHLISNTWPLVWYARLTGDSKKIQAGEYSFPANASLANVLKQISTGDVVVHRFTIIEGWRFSQMMAALEAAPMLQHTLIGLSPSDIMAKLQLPEQHPEGLFFPATYRYTMATSDIEILRQAYQMMQQRLTRLWPTRAVGLPYQTPYQALIVASMIEKETALTKEKPLIAGVIIKRLRKNMYLQIDPTVIYALGNDYTGNLNRKDMRNQSPYNTYTHKGLPPTPIAMPSESSIDAALHPQFTNALYFMATGDGSHVFSKSLRQHDKAIGEYYDFIKQERQLVNQFVPDLAELNYGCNSSAVMIGLARHQPRLARACVCEYLPYNLQFLCDHYD